MIHSMFVSTNVGEILLEKHWKAPISRVAIEPFFSQLASKGAEGLPPVVAMPRLYFINILRHELYFVAVLTEEMSPLFVIEFLHRFVDTVEDYFKECTRSTFENELVTLYELLEEMLDNGFPITTEPNVLKEMILPPNIMRKVVNIVAGGPGSNMSQKLPTGQLSNVPWRKAGVKYTTNEVFFDFVEEIDAIVDRNGNVVSADIQGHVAAKSQLSGMPDLVMTFQNGRLLEDVSLHPCVRLKKWEAERVLSFVPPDGAFKLCTYHVTSTSMMQMPIYVRPEVKFIEGASRMSIEVGSRSMGGKSLEGVELVIPMPHQVGSCNLESSKGSYSFDQVNKTLRWDIGRIEAKDKPPVLKGSIILNSATDVPDVSPTISVQFQIPSYAVSGVKVNRVDIYGEKYKPFKGVKYMTKAGKFLIRT